MPQPFLRTRVGRRLFLSFLIAALLPLGGLAVYAYRAVDKVLAEAVDSQLRQESKVLGMDLIQAINWRAQALERLVALHPAGMAPGQAGVEGFLALAPWTGTLAAEADRHLAAGRPLLRLHDTRQAAFLIQTGPRGRVLEARFDPVALWRQDEAPEHYCILFPDRSPLYCSPTMRAPPTPRWPAAGDSHNAGTFDWPLRGETFRVGYWRARLNAAYAHPGFVVLVGENKSAAMQALHRFRLVFLSATLLAAGLALLLAINRIRSQMRPLERLSDTTRRIASGDFSADDQVERDDEFGSLGHAINRMAENLRHKFHMLRMLGDLDRAILNTSEMDHVVQLVLDHIQASIPCDDAGILRLDEAGGGLLALSARPDRAGEARRADCRDAFALVAGTLAPWYWIAPGTPLSDCLRSAYTIAPPHILAFPVRIKDRVESVLLLFYRQVPEDIDDITAAGRSLTDRLAVAASNIAWEETLYHQSHYDALTDLPNRVLLRDRLEQALMRAQRDRSEFAVMLIDLDQFKQVNDSLGHSAGDTLLVECARRLRAAMRQSDTAARLGGDEFVLIIPDLVHGSAAGTLDRLARKLSMLLAEPVRIAERMVAMQASIGIALYPANASSHEDLLKMADAAMYEAKRQASGSYRFYSAEMNAEVSARFELTQDLRQALGNDELVLYYQPKVDAHDARLVGAEALVRWRSPTRGLVPPARFVPLIDELGLGNWLGEWVMDRACAQMAAWDAAGLPPITVSVNLTPSHFSDSTLFEHIRATLSRHGLAPARLELEILEATAATDSPEILATLNNLRALGHHIALDDFGTGYSSLVYLTKLPANVLKLDRQFIVNLVTDRRQRAIVERIVALATVLGYRVIAEGVEDESQRGLLAAMGCDEIQGYLYSPPVPAERFAEMLRAGACPQEASLTCT